MNQGLDDADTTDSEYDEVPNDDDAESSGMEDDEKQEELLRKGEFSISTLSVAKVSYS